MPEGYDVVMDLGEVKKNLGAEHADIRELGSRPFTIPRFALYGLKLRFL